MKKFLQSTILVAFILCCINANAKTKLSISTTMPTTIKVIIDGQKFYSQSNSISINNLQNGYHQIAVYYIKGKRDFNDFYNNGNNRYWKKVVSRDIVVRNNFQYDITINKFGKAFYDQDYYDNSNSWNDEGNDFDSNNEFDVTNGYNENYDDWDYFRKKDNKNHLQNIEPIRNNFSNNGMNNQLFAQVKQTMQQQNFESSKLTFAKQSIDKNTITTNQAKEMIDLLSMEIDKLDFAKYAYDKVVDKDKYFTVSNCLSMQISKDDLLKYGGFKL